MKRVIFDHNVRARLLSAAEGVRRQLARDLGRQELCNGKLLRTAEDNGFHVLLTGDKSLPDEQNMIGRQIGLVAISANNWNVVRDYVPAISEALHRVKPGQVLHVFCGKFVPWRLQRRSP